MGLEAEDLAAGAELCGTAAIHQVNRSRQQRCSSTELSPPVAQCIPSDVCCAGGEACDGAATALSLLPALTLLLMLCIANHRLRNSCGRSCPTAHPSTCKLRRDFFRAWRLALQHCVARQASCIGACPPTQAHRRCASALSRPGVSALARLLNALEDPPLSRVQPANPLLVAVVPPEVCTTGGAGGLTRRERGRYELAAATGAESQRKAGLWCEPGTSCAHFVLCWWMGVPLTCACASRTLSPVCAPTDV